MNKQLQYKGFAYLFIFFISLYFLLSAGRFHSADEVNVYMTAQSLITKGELSIAPNCAPLKGKDGKPYTHKGIGLSIAAIPYYITGVFLEKVLPPRMITMIGRGKIGDIRDFFSGDIKITAVSQLDVHFSALVCCMFYLLLLRFGFSIRTAVVSALILGTSTIVCVYSKTFFDHTFACFTMLVSLYLIFSERTNFNLLLSGVFLGISICTRSENTILTPFYLGYIFAKEQGPSSAFKLSRELINKMIVFLAPVLTALIFVMFINFLKFGFHMQQDVFPGGPSVWFRGSLLTGLYGELFSIGKSIFIFSPPLIVSIFYAKRFLHDYKQEAMVLYAISISFIIFYSKWICWHGQWGWGDRFLLIIVPLLLLPIGYFIENIFARKTPWKIMLSGFFVLMCFFLQVLGMTPWLFDLIWEPEWNKIINSIPNIDVYGTICIFVPKLSQIILHWKVLLAGKYIDFWFYHICKNYGIGWMLFFMILPILGLTVSVRGLLKITVKE